MVIFQKLTKKTKNPLVGFSIIVRDINYIFLDFFWADNVGFFGVFKKKSKKISKLG